MSKTTIPRANAPVVCPEGYDLHVYCDRDVNRWEHFHHNAYMGRNRAEARRMAREDGWRLNSDGTATCRTCLKGGSCPL